MYIYLCLGYTFFVPTDEAFKKLGLQNAPDNLLSNKEGLLVLLSHFVKGRLYDRDIKNNTTLTSLSNRTLHITRGPGNLFISKVESSFQAVLFPTIVIKKSGNRVVQSVLNISGSTSYEVVSSSSWFLIYHCVG